MIKKFILAILLATNLTISSPVLSAGYVLAQDTTAEQIATSSAKPSTLSPRPETPTQPVRPETPTPPPTPSSPARPASPTHQVVSPSPSTSPSTSPSASSVSPDTKASSGGQNTLGAAGGANANIVTSDATASGFLTNNVNNNSAEGSGGEELENGTSATNEGNGANSNTNGQLSSTNDTNTNLTNNAILDNNFTAVSETGDNNASYSTGNGNVVTGDATTSGTVLNGVNTNAFGATEFTVTGDHVGDIVLMGPNATTGCSTNCGAGGVVVKNVGNGAGSYSLGTVNNTGNTNTNVSNTAGLTTDVNLTAVSGQNDANYNVGNGNITTGDANAAANVLNAVNSNIAAGGMFVINVVGDLVGDIILPVITGNGCATCGGTTMVNNSNNGAGSQNSGSVNTATTDNTTLVNGSDIANNITLNGNTGNNGVDFNNGNNSIDTGNVSLSANVVNVSNVNVAGSDPNAPIWLVFVNNMGEWAGQIFDKPQGQTMVGSDGIQFAQNGDGTVTATNANNGAYSQNDAHINSTNNTNTTMTNNAAITNNIHITGDTGNNNASYNVDGGNIKTGNVNGAVNLLNFVNNNFAGRPVYVAVVNVFGKWVGNVVDKARSNSQEPSHGGTSQSNTVQTVNNGQSTQQVTPSPTLLASALLKKDQGVGSPIIRNTANTNKAGIVLGSTNDLVSSDGDTSTDQGGTVTITASSLQDNSIIYWPFVIFAILLPVLTVSLKALISKRKLARLQVS